MQRDEAIHRLISPSRSVPDSTTSPAAIFLSYAREDAAAAQRLAEALRSSGIEVWFDQSELRGGDAWDQNIRRQIKDCALFLPVISAHTQARGEGYFRLEWKLAVERTHLMAEGVPFLAPVVIDDTSESAAEVPAEFLRVQWTRLARGLPSAQFVEQITRLLAQPRTPGATRNSAASSASAAPRAKSGTPSWVWAAAVIGVVGVIAFLATRKPEPPAAPEKPIAETKSAPAAPAAPVVSDKSIAVLPFANMSEDKDANAFFADGIHEDILTNLANIAELRVVSRTSVMEYRGTTKKIPQIARELGVAYILEGSVRRSGTQVRITGQLIRAADDAHLWAKSYDRELTPKEMFAIQAALSTEIAGALQAAISPETKKLLEHRPTENLAAYELYLKARPLSIADRTSLKAREKFLQAAVELDPNFAEAWGELAVVHAAYVLKEFENTPARLAQADAAIANALRLAPDNPEVIRSLGTYAYDGYRDYPRAIAQFEKVLRLQPNNTRAIFFLGAVQVRQGHPSEAIGNYRRAVELDPGNPVYLSQLALALRTARRWDEAITMQRRVITLRPGDLAEQSFLTRDVFGATGSTKEADAWLARLTPEQFGSPLVINERKFWANVKGDFVEWKRLDALQPDYDDGGTLAGSQAIVASMILASHGDAAGARARLGNFPAEIRSALVLQPNNELLWSALARIEALLGQKDEALRDARKAVELKPETFDAADGARARRNLAVVYAWTGDKDSAIAELSRLLRVPSGGASVHYLRVDPLFAPLRGDPRFEALLNDPKNNAPLF